MGAQSLYCPIRRQWMPDLPEERVRQRLIQWMTSSLGYPASLLAVERGLQQMPHLSLTPKRCPTRRADLLCFGNNIHPQHALYPLLLVECKAHPITAKCIQQLLGYNYFVQAYFVAIVNGTEIKISSYRTPHFLPGLPEYHTLLAWAKGEVNRENQRERGGFLP